MTSGVNESTKCTATSRDAKEYQNCKCLNHLYFRVPFPGPIPANDEKAVDPVKEKNARCHLMSISPGEKLSQVLFFGCVVQKRPRVN